ncbi:DUF5908 family protein [Ekhidna sp.]|uniref:DUF5908 family protein n=1 Tax=Ekhidna sp. TaxID=2608089 RepID=UPI003299AE16
MPVEIKELIIRTNIVPQENIHGKSEDISLTKKQMRNIVDDCVSQVIKRLERKNER